MSRMAKANIFLCIIIITQLFLAIAVSSFYEEITSFMPIFSTAYSMIAANQIISVFIPTVLFTFFFCRAEKIKISGFLRISPLSGKNIALIVAMSLFIQPLMGILSLVSQLVFSNNVSGIALVLADELSYLPVIMTIAVMPAVFEELALRGAILGAYGTELDERRVILINGLFFGMVHLDGQQLLYAIALGIFFSYIVLRTGSIFAGIISHFTINATQATLMFFMRGMLEMYGTDDYAAQQAAAEAAVGDMDAFAAATILLSFILFFVIAGASYVIFFKLLARFSKDNPAKAECPYIPVTALADNEADELPEIVTLKNALTSRDSFFNSFYMSFTAAVSLYMVVMSVSGVIQVIFLSGVFVFFILALFFLRVRS